MALAFNIQTTAVPIRKHGHVAVTWKNATLIWGGYSPHNSGDKKSTVHYHHRGKWTPMETSGDLPQFFRNAEAHVLKDKMFVLNQDNNGQIVMHTLDLHSWIWTKLIPSGTSPSRDSTSIGSWTYNGKIYFLGGINFSTMIMSNQFVIYNVSTNSWEWPEKSGDVPSPRLWPLITISDDSVFLFGGFTDGGYCNDLHLLDMPSMRWQVVHGNSMSNGQGPTFSSSRVYSFTNISQSSAAIIGAYKDSGHYIDDCWLLNLHNAKKLMDPSVIWTKITNPYPRCWHAAVMQPLSRRLWVIGGFEDHKYPNATYQISYATNILKLNFTKLCSLKDLAMDYVARNICAHDPRLAPEDQMTRQLRDEIEAYRCEIGDQYSCPDEDWRKSACPLEEKRKSYELPSS